MQAIAQPPIRVVLVEDHAAIRQALVLALSREPTLAVVGQAGSLAEARQQLSGVDVALLDLDLPDGSGLELIPELHAANRRADALILTASDRQLDLARAIDAGAAGLVHKRAPLDEVVRAVQRVAAGEPLVARDELRDLMRLARETHASEHAIQQVVAELTRREREVLTALGQGLSDREIAERLFVSKFTIHAHMVNLLRKLGVASRMQALLFAIKAGIVTLE